MLNLADDCTKLKRERQKNNAWHLNIDEWVLVLKDVTKKQQTRQNQF